MLVGWQVVLARLAGWVGGWGTGRGDLVSDLCDLVSDLCDLVSDVCDLVSDLCGLVLPGMLLVLESTCMYVMRTVHVQCGDV